MLDKKMLVVINPCAGQKRANRYLTDILGIFSSGGYECTVFVTQKRGDATEFVKRRASMFDAVVCIGGDGTFNEVMMGVISSEANVPIGYIPAGSTNDFANSLKLSKDILQAASRAVSMQAALTDDAFHTLLRSERLRALRTPRLNRRKTRSAILRIYSKE